MGTEKTREGREHAQVTLLVVRMKWGNGVPRIPGTPKPKQAKL